MLQLPRKLWPMALVAILASCQSDTPTAVSEAEVRQTIAQVNLSRHRNFDDERASLADELPGFAGLFLDSTGRLIVRLTDRSRLEEFKSRISQFLTRDDGENDALRTQHTMQVDAAGSSEAQYDFRQLHTWYVRVAPALTAVDGVTMKDIDERRNRIVIGVADEGRISSVRSAISRLDVPADAIIVEQFDPVEIQVGRALSLSLRGTNRPVVGGLQINSIGGTCTLGYNVAFWFDGEYQEEYFVTNAHCTSFFGAVSAHSMGQLFDIIGYESVDPPTFTNSADPRCPLGQQCRYSDAALFLYNGSTSFSHGGVAWPAVGSINYSLTRYVEGNGPPIEGMLVHKVGQKTGRTTGIVSQSCADVEQFAPGGASLGRTMLCQGVANYDSEGGDSGAPVVQELSNGFLVNRGIHWGTGSVFSTGQEWRNELLEPLMGGPGVYALTPSLSFGPPPPPPPPPAPIQVTIDGPAKMNVEAEDSCTWDADTSNGSGPKSYEWKYDGTVVGSDFTLLSDSFYRGEEGEHDLMVTVWDDTGSDSDSMEVEVEIGLIFYCSI